MAQHHLKASPETCHWGWFDAGMAPVMTISSGDRVTVETVSGAPEDLPGEGYHIPPELLDIHKRSERRMPGHLLTGHAPLGALVDVQQLRRDVIALARQILRRPRHGLHGHAIAAGDGHDGRHARVEPAPVAIA